MNRLIIRILVHIKSLNIFPNAICIIICYVEYLKKLVKLKLYVGIGIVINTLESFISCLEMFSVLMVYLIWINIEINKNIMFWEKSQRIFVS